MACIQDIVSGFLLPPVTFNTRALSSSTANAGELSGSPLVVMNNSGATPGTYTTRTAALMVGDTNLLLWWILLVNGQGTGTLTLAGGSGVTVAGTATVAPITARLFIAQVTNPATPTITITGQAISMTATALAFGV